MGSKSGLHTKAADRPYVSPPTGRLRAFQNIIALRYRIPILSHTTGWLGYHCCVVGLRIVLLADNDRLRVGTPVDMVYCALLMRFKFVTLARLIGIALVPNVISLSLCFSIVLSFQPESLWLIEGKAWHGATQLTVSLTTVLPIGTKSV
ncbi:hypothetical protein BDV36DRAFT_166196 [Aspergillus pseudocaelatus]|uniref:Uncharacterized protein n=1 Tax=Aspergillus pseudocaelatus TaxID=1825620 RepID=A0ABQ6WLR7_9EURO|nr:hypothetical protein BDV36DRAFT_166196 [Aspergillus pseudocaelatus]